MTANDDRDRELEEIESHLRGDMNISEKHDTWTIIAVAANIVVTICSVAWLQGKNDQRVTTVERDVAELKNKEGKDSEQDVKIAVISTQLATINAGIGEVKAKLEQRQ